MKCIHPIQLKNGDIVPCGKCYSCLANQRQEWIFRLRQEYLASNFAIFVTLTYSDDYIPADFSVNKRDVQLFNKRLRKHFPSQDLRFYLVSEYGDHTFRPHYHGLYFFQGTYDQKFIYDVFEKSWNKGFIKFGEVEEGSIVYCTKYCLKHSTTPSGRKPTFRLMSKMHGGIGNKYIDNMFEYHMANQQFNFVSHDGKTCRMPRYYRVQLGYKPDRLQYQDELYSSGLDDFRKRYADFTRVHREFSSVEERQAAFIVSERERKARAEELVLKHCKKQKM